MGYNLGEITPITTVKSPQAHPIFFQAIDMGGFSLHVKLAPGAHLV